MDFSEFIERYYSDGVNDIQKEDLEDWVKVKIYGDEDSVLELWSEGAEVLIDFGETHWHIDEYSEPCDMNAIYRSTIHSVLDILDGKIATCSYWVGNTCKGGSSFNTTEDQTIERAKEIFNDFDLVKIKRWGKMLKEIDVTGQ